MNDDEFWKIIERSGGDPESLAKALTTMPVEEVVQWDVFLQGLVLAVHRHPVLRDLALEATGRHSDDAVDDVASWLVLQGRTMYQAALEDPEILNGQLDRGCQSEELTYCAGDAYPVQTGLDIDSYEAVFGEFARENGQ